MKTKLLFKKLLIIPLLFLVGNVLFGQTSSNVSCPWISQNVCSDVWTLCGHTSVEMVLSKYDNRTPSANNVLQYNAQIRTMRGQTPASSCYGSGTPNPNDLIWLMNQYGFSAKWYGSSSSSYSNNNGALTLQNLADFLNQDIPVIVQVHTGMNTSNGTHWMVLREIGTDFVKLNDPGTSYSTTGNNRQFTLQQFLTSWQSSACDKIAIIVDKKANLNQNLPIYAGKVSAPKSIDLFIPESSFPNNFQTSQVSNIQITMSGLVKNIPSSRITGTSQEYIPNYQNVGIPWRKISLQVTANDISGIPNSHTYGTISFDLNNGGTKKYQNNNIYFTDFFNTSTTLTDVNDLDNWVEIYVRNGANQGLFRGTSLTTFLPAENLTREQAAIVLVNAASRLKLLSVETSTSINGSFADVPSSHRSFKYIQTLRNYGFISANTNFNPENFITVGEFCKMLANTFKIQSTDYAPAVFLNGLQRRIIAQHSDPSLQDAMTRLLNIVDIREKNGFWVTENNWDFFDFSSISSTSSSYIVYGTAYVNRATMAKVMYNLANWKARNTGVALQRNALNTNTTPNISDMVAYGEKYDNASITATSTPITPAQQTYSCASGGNVTISYNPGSLPQHYYWSMQKNNGSNVATLTSNNSAHSSVTFNAPTVSVPTQWKLYTYTANNKGKARETYITINVGGSSGGSNASPTQQAYSLSLYGATSSSLTASWTRGNGQNCIVTCKEVGANAQDVPDSGVVYTGNTNFASAPAIFNGSDTKVVYTGTGSSCNISGLNPNTQYQIAVFEYNGTTPSTVLYNLSNAPISTGNTLTAVNTTPSANFSWDESLTFQTGQSFTFTNTSTNANSYQWSITPSENISNTSSATTTNITFANSGQHTLTLIATNSSTGVTSTRTHNFYVYNSTELLPDFQPTNLNFTSPMVGGQNLTTTCTIINNSSASASVGSNVQFVLSTDQNFDQTDTFLGQENFTLNAGQSITVSHLINSINNSYSGNYYIVAKVDFLYDNPSGFITESNESNNVISKAIVIQAALPDFVALSLTATPNTVASGQQFSVTGTYRNIGNGDKNGYSPLSSFYISTDNVLSQDDILLSYTLTPNTGGNLDYANSPIVSGTNNNIRLPYSLPNGNYYLFSAIDFSFNGLGFAWDGNVETSETNNWVSTPITVSNPNQPTINASNYSITNITSNSMRVNWTRGNGAGCILLGRGPSYLPNKTRDGFSYTANSNFSLATGINGIYTNENGEESYSAYSYIKVLYDGTNNYADITGLSPDETYSFVVLEYNGTGTNKDYLQTTAINGITAHTLGQNQSTAFSRIDGTINSTYATSSYNTPQTIKFFDENNGLIFRNEDGIGKTNDGGKTWLYSYNPIIEKNKTSWLKNSFWLNNGYGWLVFENSNLLKTTDFGLTWTQKKFDRSCEDVHFVNQNVGYVTLFGGSDSVIQKTTDGGNSWSVVGTFPKKISSIFFLNDSLGWATTTSTTTSENKIILKTTNGGLTWSQNIVTTPNQFAFITDIYFTDANNGYAMTLNGWLLKTVNGGESWLLNNIFNLSTNANSYSKIDFVNLQVGYINLLNKKIAKTTDGGENWVINDIQNDITSGSIAEIDALNDNIIYVGGYTGLLKSTTSGQTNSIALNALAQTSYCSNQVINLPYNITGIYSPSNIFNVELSDASGNFTSSNILQSFTSAGSGNINVAIPQNIAVGTGYKLRIVGTSPNIVSNVTNTFAITTAPQATISITPATTTICPNTNLTFTATPTNGGTAPTYIWKKNGVVVGSNSATYNATGLNNGDIVWAEMVSNQACGSSTPVIATPTTINVTQIDSPFIQAIDNILAASTDVGVQWIRNGQPIAGATSQFYEATQTGFYQFSVTVSGCTVLSDIYQLTTLGTDDNVFNSNTISVYPNPTNDVLHIKSIDNTLTNLVLIDLQGRKISEHKTNGNTYQINLQNLPSAIYLLQIETDKGKQTVKVVKK